MMQRRLSQIAQIPLIIQTALETVTKAFEQFLPDDGEIEAAADELQQTEAALAGLSLDDDDDDDDARPAESCASDTEYDASDTDYERSSIVAGEPAEADEGVSFVDDETEQPPQVDPNVALLEAEREREAAELKLLREQKLQKINKLDQSWPWGNMEKKIHRY